MEPVESAEDEPAYDEEKWYNPRTVDPRDRFSIPSHELRKEKYHHLEKLKDDKDQEKVDREAADIDRKSKRIIEYNKKSLRENETKFNAAERKDLLSRQKLHKKLKKQNSNLKMEKDLDEELEVENTIKRANQITSAVKSFEQNQQHKDAMDQAEEDAFYREDKENEKLEKQLKRELEKEEQKDTKRQIKEKAERAEQGLDRLEKFTYPGEDEKQKASSAKSKK